MRNLFKISIILLISVNVFAEEFCFRDSIEYEKHKSKLPSVLRKIPVVVGAEDEGMFIDVFAILKIYFQDQTIVLESDSWEGTARYSDSYEIEKVCFNTEVKTFNIEFKIKKEVKGKYTDTDLIIPGAVLKKITPEVQQRISNKINKKAPKPEVDKEVTK